MKKVCYVGLDVHKEKTVIGATRDARGPAEIVDTVASNVYDVLKALDRLGPPERLRVCYEAGPTGFGLARRLREEGYHCIVVAPSLIPRRAGERIKTDRRDAAKLARYLRSGELTEVCIPEEQTEAMRDLERARQDAVQALGRVRHQLDKFLLRHGRAYPPGHKKWGPTHRAWLNGQAFAEEAQRRVLGAYLRHLDEAQAEVAALTKDIEELVARWTKAPLVKALQALRGVKVVTAASLAAEIGDFGRFPNPRQLMAYVGLVPSEHSSGASRRQGGITRTGNREVRRLLVESAWSYRHPARLSREIRARQEGQTDAVKAIAWKAQRRLHGRYLRLVQRGKPLPKVVTSLARELAGFVWAIARAVGAPASTPGPASGSAAGALRRQGRPALASCRVRPQGPAGLAGEGRTATAKPAAGLPGRPPGGKERHARSVT